jgi:hypothetical protein
MRADVKTIPFPPFVVAHGGRIDTAPSGFIPCGAVNIFRTVWHHEFGPAFAASMENRPGKTAIFWSETEIPCAALLAQS